MNVNRLFKTSSGRVWLWRSFCLILTVGFLLSGSMVGAGEPTPPPETTIPDNGLVEMQETNTPTITNTKLDSSLNQLLDIHRNNGMTRSQTFATTHGMVIEGDMVQVVILTTPQAIDKLTDSVTSLGGEVQGHHEGRLQVLVPIDSLESLAEQQHVQRIREPSQPITLELMELGSAITEGLAASNVVAWHTAGYNGTGVRVAVIDVGFTNYSTLLGSDLPSSVGTYDWTESGMSGSEHGTACAEIVHDMAPGASIDLHKISTDVQLGQAVSRAISDGVDIISMSLGWTLDGPGDGTGYLASIVANARSHGIFYATAAGNEAEVTWAGYYDNSGTNDYHAWDGASVWYNFMGSSPSSCYNFYSGTRLSAGLHWDDWDAVNQDYNLHLYRWPLEGNIIYPVASSTNTQNGVAGQTPVEYISYTAAGENCYAWVVERVSSNRNVCLRLSAPKTGHLNYWTTSRSITFPADSQDAVTVGSVDVNSPYSLENYSSQGPTFGTSGVCSGGSIKPDIVAYANVSTASYGSTGFNGTSAATPHVAGAAALVKQLYPAYTVAQLQNYIESEALDMGAPGKDNLYGWGRLYLSINNPLPTIISLSPSSATAGGSAFTLTVNGTGFVNGASTVRWNGSNRATTYVSNTQLTASISAADIATAATASINVFNSAPGGGTSNTKSFTINNPTPTITSLSPSSATAGGSAFTLTVNGTGFVNGASTVRWNGSNRVTTFVSNTQLTASISAADIATATTASINVFNSAPGGGTSNTKSFTIDYMYVYIPLVLKSLP